MLLESHITIAEDKAPIRRSPLVAAISGTRFRPVFFSHAKGCQCRLDRVTPR